MKVLVTGGTGFIGSHTYVELVEAGHECVIVDNYVNSSEGVLTRLEKITHKEIPFYEADCSDVVAMERVFHEHEFDAVIHFAALKAVDVSVAEPLRYYSNNLGSLLNVLRVMKKHDVKKFIFSSSATVYGTPQSNPIPETAPTLQATNPYGWTKIMAEQIIRDHTAAEPEFEACVLRYFNPVGAHHSGMIGEDPQGKPDNLMPYIARVANGELEELNVFGDDYDTPDGTGVRDYIHVTDLASGHAAALDALTPGLSVYNLGTGSGVSVLEAIKAYEDASGKSVKYKVVDRRPGDIAEAVADPSKANSELGWRTEKTFADACKDSWHWQTGDARR